MAPNGTNFDYRYCWLRDSYYVVRTLNELGATETLENYLRFLSNVVAATSEEEEGTRDHKLQPVYGIALENRLHQREMHRLAGYRGKGPVILGTADAESIQHDVYGAVILSLTTIFFDRRLLNQGNEILFAQMEELGERAVKCFDKPDSGPSGKRILPKVHTFSSVMCWAACDRLARIADKLKLTERASYWTSNAQKIYNTIMEKAFNTELNSFISSWGDTEVDAFLLWLPRIGFISDKDPKFQSTLKLVEARLKRGNYITSSEKETTVHAAATFSYITALHNSGRTEDARQLFESMLKTVNHVGLLSETSDPDTNELWGNFPQSTAMVGLINCAMRLSKPWNF